MNNTLPPPPSWKPSKPAEPRRFAENTTVPVEASKMEVERLLRKHGATSFISGWSEESNQDTMIFKMSGRMFRFAVARPQESEFPAPPAPEKSKRGRPVGSGDPKIKVEAEHRRRWRARLLITKAKLEMIADGQSTIEVEFMANMLLPNGNTMAEEMLPRLTEAYENGTMRYEMPLLGSGTLK